MQTYKCTEQDYKDTLRYEEYFLLNSYANGIHLEAVFDGESVVSGIYKPFTETRKSLEISTSIPGISKSALIIDEPNSLSDIRESVNEFL